MWARGPFQGNAAEMLLEILEAQMTEILSNRKTVEESERKAVAKQGGDLTGQVQGAGRIMASRNIDCESSEIGICGLVPCIWGREWSSIEFVGSGMSGDLHVERVSGTRTLCLDFNGWKDRD